jgi:hypothetical protein
MVCLPKPSCFPSSPTSCLYSGILQSIASKSMLRNCSSDERGWMAQKAMISLASAIYCFNIRTLTQQVLSIILFLPHLSSPILLTQNDSKVGRQCIRTIQILSLVSYLRTPKQSNSLPIQIDLSLHSKSALVSQRNEFYSVTARQVLLCHEIPIRGSYFESLCDHNLSAAL